MENVRMTHPDMPDAEIWPLEISVPILRQSGWQTDEESGKHPKKARFPSAETFPEA